jgi:hypothetical protein
MNDWAHFEKRARRDLIPLVPSFSWVFGAPKVFNRSSGFWRHTEHGPQRSTPNQQFH